MKKHYKILIVHMKHRLTYKVNVLYYIINTMYFYMNTANITLAMYSVIQQPITQYVIGIALPPI